MGRPSRRPRSPLPGLSDYAPRRPDDARGQEAQRRRRDAQPSVVAYDRARVSEELLDIAFVAVLGFYPAERMTEPLPLRERLDRLGRVEATAVSRTRERGGVDDASEPQEVERLRWDVDAEWSEDLGCDAGEQWGQRRAFLPDHR